MPKLNRFRPSPTATALALGLALGWALASHRLPVAKGGGGDRYGDYSLTTGTIAVQYDQQTKTQASQDAVYFLDYKGARLLATVPVQRQMAGSSKVIDGFIERDLLADFRVDVERGANPHFLMTPGSLGAFGDGCAPLFVFETTTKQVAVYKLKVQSIGAKASSRFELLEIRAYTGAPTAESAP